jgi:polysaccharide pyruvyl transferase WcaK-like protein
MSRSVAPRIALLSCYSGANLGDGAIHDATIHGLQARLPSASLWSINLDPAQVSGVHGVPSFGMCGMRVPWYKVDNRTLEERPPPRAGKPSEWPPVTPSGRVLPAVRSLLAPFRPVFRASRGAWASRDEPGHLLQSRRFVSGLDAILVTGGGQIDDEWGGSWAHPYSLFRWATLARRAGVPFFFLSVGLDRLELPLARWFISRALRKATYRSFRDEGSKEMLLGLGARVSDPCVPDLAFGLTCPPVARTADAPLRIGISPIAFARKGYWPGAEGDVFVQYMETLEAFIALLGKRGIDPVLFASSEQDESTLGLLQRLVHERQGRLLTVVRTTRASELLHALSRIHIAVTSRLHGTILAHLCGVPTATLSFADKVRAQMESFGLGRYCIDLQDANVEWLADAVDDLTSRRPDIAQQLENRAAAARRRVDAQFDEVVGLIVRTSHSKMARSNG